MFGLGFIVGLIAGCVIGMLLLSGCTVAKNSDQVMDKYFREECHENEVL